MFSVELNHLEDLANILIVKFKRLGGEMPSYREVSTQVLNAMTLVWITDLDYFWRNKRNIGFFENFVLFVCLWEPLFVCLSICFEWPKWAKKCIWKNERRAVTRKRTHAVETYQQSTAKKPNFYLLISNLLQPICKLFQTRFKRFQTFFNTFLLTVLRKHWINGLKFSIVSELVVLV